MKKSVLVAAACVTVFFISASCGPAMGQTCTSEGEYSTEYSGDVVALDANSFRVTMAFTLSNAEAPMYFTPLTFLDKTQYAYQAPVELDCGETYTWNYEVHGDALEVHAVNVYVQPDLPIPLGFEAYVPETLPIKPVELWSLASNHDGVWTKLFGKSPELLPTDIPYRRFKRNGPNYGYLYLSDNHLRPDYMTTLPGKTLDFNIYFAEITPNNRAGIYTITCLVDDRQVPVFGKQLAWSAAIADDEAVTIPAQVKVKETGWHQLHCTVLNSLYDKQGEINEYPYSINALYIYKEP